MANDQEKEAAARASLQFVKDGQVVGLGTGLTAAFFIKLLAERVKAGLRIRGIPTSVKSRVLLQRAQDPRAFSILRAWASCRPMRCMSWWRRKSSPSPTAERWGADPNTLEAPLAQLLSADYTARLAARIDMRRAAPARNPAARAGDTTYFCTADGEGNAVSGVQSINSGFGSGVMAGDTGILLNNRMSYWHLEPGHPNRLQPGRRQAHNEPAIGSKGRRAVVRLRHTWPPWPLVWPSR